VPANPRIEDLRRRLEKDPASRLFAQLAEELRKEGELQEAIRVSRDGLLKHPNYPSARITLGRALLELGEARTAKLELESALKGAPDSILASRYLGEALAANGDVEGALKRYRLTLTLAPGDKAIQARIQELEARAMGRTGEAGAAKAPAAAPASRPGGAEPGPIPLVAADEAFELERPYESPSTRLGATPEPPAATAPGPSVVEQDFELEQPWASPVTQIGSRPAAPQAGPRMGEEDMFVAEELEDARTLPRTLPKPPPAPPAGEQQPLASPTLAELYFSQGATERAIDVLKEVLRRAPGSEQVRARLAELEALQRGLPPGDHGAPSGSRRELLERRIARLEGLLRAVQAMRRE
jgi:tetratricopeptide (TPR) repeat protein